MKLSKTNFILGIVTVFIIFLFVKSADIGFKLFQEIKNPPAKITVTPCSKKNLNSDYSKYLYNYFALGIKC